MATFNYTTTAAEDAAIAARLVVVNTIRAAAQQAPQTAGQMLADEFRSLFSGYASDRTTTNAEIARAAWQTASPAQRAAAIAALGAVQV